MKFFTGIFLGMILALIIVGGGAVYFLFYNDASTATKQAPALDLSAGGSKLEQAMKAPPVTSSASGKVRLTIVLPESLRSIVPANPSVEIIVKRVEAAPSEANLFNGSLVPVQNVAEFPLPAGSKAGDYKVVVHYCKGGLACGLEFPILLEGKSWFSLDKPSDEKTQLDLGNVVLPNLYAPAGNCDATKPLLSGTVIPVGNLSIKPNQKLALVLTTMPPRSDLLLARGNPADGEIGAKIIYLKGFKKNKEELDRPILLYSGPFELKQGGTAFTVPPVQSSPARIIAAVVVCQAGESHQDCAAHAALPPMNTPTVPGRFYRLIAENFVVPQCNMKDLRFYLHEFQPPGVAAATGPAAGMPKEIIEGAGY